MAPSTRVFIPCRPLCGSWRQLWPTQKGRSGAQESVSCVVSSSPGVPAEAEDVTSGPCGPCTGLSDRAQRAGMWPEAGKHMEEQDLPLPAAANHIKKSHLNSCSHKSFRRQPPNLPRAGEDPRCRTCSQYRGKAVEVCGTAM